MKEARIDDKRSEKARNGEKKKTTRILLKSASLKV